MNATRPSRHQCLAVASVAIGVILWALLGRTVDGEAALAQSSGTSSESPGLHLLPGTAVIVDEPPPPPRTASDSHLFENELDQIDAFFDAATFRLSDRKAVAVQLTGRIVDVESGKPLASQVELRADDASYVVLGRSDAVSGAFQFDVQSRGQIELRFTLDGYAPLGLVHPLALSMTPMTTRAVPVDLGVVAIGRPLAVVGELRGLNGYFGPIECVCSARHAPGAFPGPVTVASHHTELMLQADGRFVGLLPRAAAGMWLSLLHRDGLAFGVVEMVSRTELQCIATGVAMSPQGLDVYVTRNNAPLMGVTVKLLTSGSFGEPFSRLLRDPHVGGPVLSAVSDQGGIARLALPASNIRGSFFVVANHEATEGRGQLTSEMKQVNIHLAPARVGADPAEGVISRKYKFDVVDYDSGRAIAPYWVNYAGRTVVVELAAISAINLGGNPRCTVGAEGYASATQVFTSAEQPATVRLAHLVEQRVMVVDRAGIPCSGIGIAVYPNGQVDEFKLTHQNLTTDAEGVLEGLRLRPGVDYSLRPIGVRGGGVVHELIPGSIGLQQGSEIQVVADVERSLGPVLGIDVYDASGRPVVPLYVECLRRSMSALTADGKRTTLNGMTWRSGNRILLSGMGAQTWDLWCATEAGGQAWIPISGSTPNPTSLVARETATIEGDVSYANGAPARRTFIRAALLGAPDIASEHNPTADVINGGRWVTSRSRKSDDDGRFRIEGLVPGTYRVVALMPGAFNEISDEIYVEASGGAGVRYSATVVCR